jgi:hypothetical protein
MKVQVYSNFSKKKIWKKMKSLSSMRNGRFNTSKYRASFKKWGVLYTHYSKRVGPFPKLPKKIKKIKKIKKEEAIV